MNYVAVSGGADSTALALLLWERGEEFELVFADTGAELPENYWLLPRLAQTIGRPLHVVSGGSFFQWFVAQNYFIPGPRVRWCTRILKQAPQDRWYHQNNAELIYVGIRADEPRRLGHTKPREGTHEFTYPLAEAGYGKKEVKELCAKYGLLNPAYQWRTNVSCFCCFFQRKSDWLGLFRHHPDLYRVAEEWEERCRAVGKQKWGWNDRFTLRQLREADEQQLKLWPEPEGEPCVICSA